MLLPSRKKVRKIAAVLGLFPWLRKLIFIYRGDRQPEIDRRFYESLINQDDLIFDVGANRGQSSECFIGLGARVVAFEPQLKLHNQIRQICEKSNNLIIDPSGLGSRIEDREMFITEYDQCASLREDWEGVRIGKQTIAISILDAKIVQYGAHRYCNIDVEGWEPEVLHGLSEALEIISFEYHLSDNELVNSRKVLVRLSELGAYWCNIRESFDQNFLMPHFVSINDFLQRFPDQLGIDLKDSYGDVIAVLDPSQIGPDSL